MTWLSEGEPPPHPCTLPSVFRMSDQRPEQGFAARLSDDDGDEPQRTVYAGARWQCDSCQAIWTLNSDGEWEREHGNE